ILIIDGLDECSNDRNEWRSILFILAKMVQEYHLPLQILVCSRPELRIKDCFHRPEFRNICHWMSLDDTYQASQDIRLFLLDGFKGIFARHTHSMQHITFPWPTSEQIEYLVQKSSGHFIYPSTVLKYIDDDNDVPADRLDVVLGLQVADQEGGDSPFADLDALYLQILSTVKKRMLLLHVLAVRIAFRELQRHSSKDDGAQTFIALLNIPLGTLHAVSSGIHSLFEGPSPVESGFQFCHASFADFLLDRNRSLHFH
ncbi:hypothetical protein GYMLUDRAFT_118484, partial [Collybiopsis luxurians FD-317 M1]